ncbi:MAG: hypothetical protein AB1758_09745, partial [Candidatus Eremiobacterota bacterium]
DLIRGGFRVVHVGPDRLAYRRGSLLVDVTRAATGPVDLPGLRLPGRAGPGGTVERLEAAACEPVL